MERSCDVLIKYNYYYELNIYNNFGLKKYSINLYNLSDSTVISKVMEVIAKKSSEYSLEITYHFAEDDYLFRRVNGIFVYNNDVLFRILQDMKDFDKEPRIITNNVDWLVLRKTPTINLKYKNQIIVIGIVKSRYLKILNMPSKFIEVQKTVEENARSVTKLLKSVGFSKTMYSKNELSHLNLLLKANLLHS